MLPFCPKLILTVSIELFFVLAPIIPAKNNNTHPIICPITVASIPFVIPRDAKYVPVTISAIDTPAPNQIKLLLNTDVPFFSM